MLEENKKELFLAVIEQNTDVLNKYFNDESFTDYNFTDEEGNTLLHFAADKKTDSTSSIVQNLLEKGCHPSAVNMRFETPFERAKKNNNILVMTVIKHFETKLDREIQQ